MAILNFNANEVEPSREMTPLPTGDYKVAIVASEQKPTKNGDGSYLSLELQVLEGQHKGRKVWQNLNLDNKNQQAVEIARAELSAICRAVGVMVCHDSTQLHNRPFLAKIAVEKRKDNDELTNRVKGAKSLKEAAQVPAMAGAGANEEAPWN
jgi:hypothetical protein